ncbi:hypothetical protein RAD16_12930 [Bradyrhizobium sp. 18BD]
MAAQLKITLEDDQRSHLDRATQVSGKSLSEEIRTRLSLSFLFEASGQNTCDLAIALLRLAAEVESDVGFAWFENEQARATFVAAVVDQVMSYKLSVNPKAAPRSRGARPDDPPDVLGRAIARGYRRGRQREALSLSSLARYLIEPSNEPE